MWQKLGGQVSNIRGFWTKSSSEAPDKALDTNLKAFIAGFKKYKNKGFSVNEAQKRAALETWTGKRAINAGFGKVKIDQALGPEGAWHTVEVTFFN